MNLLSEGLGGILRGNGNTLLKNNSSLIVVLIDVMNRNSTLLLLGCNHSLVYIHTIHAFPSILRQQRRMYIDYFVRKTRNDILWALPQETCQDDQIRLFALKKLQYIGRFIEILSIKNHTRDSQAFCTTYHPCLGVIGKNKRDFSQGIFLKISYNPLRIRAITRGQ